MCVFFFLFGCCLVGGGIPGLQGDVLISYIAPRYNWGSGQVCTCVEEVVIAAYLSIFQPGINTYMHIVKGV